ncbi:hypothetical protein [Saccharibacillus brassicae]|uniref:Uncharacterized protein n=1 Tax=Saccharibacillus brassicae TaxID=2583377 RepID=A0A4Y6UUV4_SACBS|nr:hypothetical protein [Saccharibacillus brassicae]QDH19785.1 hypothetical protein FFV09_02230 [Saccharibacillus brassicae]
MNMNYDLNQMLKKLPYKKQLYIKYKFDLWFGNQGVHSEEDFLRLVDLKTMNTFQRYEKTDEFRHIVSMILASRQANDLLEIYDKVKTKVANKNPDNKDIEMLLKLHKEITFHNNEAKRYFSKASKGQEEVSDGLEI